MSFVELEYTNGDKCYINVNDISLIFPNYNHGVDPVEKFEGETMISFISDKDSYIVVKGNPDEIIKMMGVSQLPKQYIIQKGTDIKEL